MSRARAVRKESLSARMATVDLQTFRNLPTQEIAHLVREAGSKVCVFTVNGTRRWFMLEHAGTATEDAAEAYLERIVQRHIELYRMLFEHGIDTLLAPAFGLHHMTERGEGYTRIAAEGLARLGGPDCMRFYSSYGVRVRFYGDYRRFLDQTPYAYLADRFDETMAGTASHDRCRLFFGVFAHDPSEAVAEMAVQYYNAHGCVPDRRALISMYYGEYVEPVDLYISFSKFRAFYMPLLTMGTEDLYFSVSPSPYFSRRQLRDILYDHLYARAGEVDYSAMSPDAQAWMKAFYRENLGSTLGTGVRRDGIWYPLPQVKWPSGLAGSSQVTRKP